MRLGGPVFVDSGDPEVIARAHRELGYRAAYTPGGLKAGDSARIKAVREAFARHDVVIAETGVWNNLMDPDEAKRQANLRAVTEGLALADELGARCCVNIAGGFNADFWAGPHLKNFSQAAFEMAVENARKIIDGVKPKTAKFTYEMMPHMLPDSADRYLKLIRAVDRPAFGVHLDIVNAINSPDRCYDTTHVIEECIEKLGQYVVSCHLKDIMLENDITVRFKEVPLGEGIFDVGAYLRGIAGLPHQPPVMLEHLATPGEYDRARAHALKVAKGLGIAIA
jgi:sugar phosphate isomerase/epimerase